jgi:inner membrane protein
MHRERHVGAAMLAYAPLGAVVLALGFDTYALLGAVVAVGLAMLPDYDQRVPSVRHRGPTHTVWFALTVGLFLNSLR